MKDRNRTLVAGFPRPMAAIHLPPVELQPELDGELVLQRVGRACIEHLIDNEAAARLGDAEGIHQMRVAVRRLRAILTTFAGMLPLETRRRAANELRWVSDLLGEARNFDVFVFELLAPARAHLSSASEFERLARAVERRRQAAYAVATKAVMSARYRASVRAVDQWLDRREWRARRDRSAVPPDRRAGPDRA